MSLSTLERMAQYQAGFDTVTWDHIYGSQQQGQMQLIGHTIGNIGGQTNLSITINCTITFSPFSIRCTITLNSKA
jgi:hypothetical protein